MCSRLAFEEHDPRLSMAGGRERSFHSFDFSPPMWYIQAIALILLKHLTLFHSQIWFLSSQMHLCRLMSDYRFSQVHGPGH